MDTHTNKLNFWKTVVDLSFPWFWIFKLIYKCVFPPILFMFAAFNCMITAVISSIILRLPHTYVVYKSLKLAFSFHQINRYCWLDILTNHIVFLTTMCFFLLLLHLSIINQISRDINYSLWKKVEITNIQPLKFIMRLANPFINKKIKPSIL